MNRYAVRKAGAGWSHDDWHFTSSFSEKCRLSWVRVILDTKLRTKAFHRDVDVRYPFAESRTAPAFTEASLLHYLNGKRTRKVSYMFGDYMRTFHAETTPALLHFIDG